MDRVVFRWMTRWLGVLLLVISYSPGVTWAAEGARIYWDGVFLDAQTGMFLSQSHLIRTTDGGQTWTPVVRREGPRTRTTGYHDLKFIDRSTGAFQDDETGSFYLTRDGGATWTPLRIGVRDATGRPRHYSRLTLAGPTTLWAIGAEENEALLWRSLDLGQTWAAVRPQGMTPRQPFEIIFLTPEVGWVVQGPFLFGTTDGGTTWEHLFSSWTVDDRPPLRFPYFLTPLLGWSISRQGITRTENGGRSWLPVEVRTTTEGRLHLTDLRFADPFHGFAVGGSGLLLRTEDGGRTWVQVPSGTLNNLHSVAPVDAQIAYIGGSDNTLLKTTDEGRTWVPLKDDLIRSLEEFLQRQRKQ